MDAYPRVRRDLRYIEQVQDGTTVWVVKDPVNLKYFRFGDLEVWLMRRLDGTRSPAVVGAELRAETGRSAAPDQVEAFVRRLKELNLAERDAAERSVLVMEEARKRRQSHLTGNGNTLVRMRFSFGDPDQLFDRIVARAPFFWTRGFALLSAVLFTVYFLTVALHWNRVAEGIAAFYRPETYTLGFIATIYVLIIGIATFHEMAHGLTCKRFGGEVHEVGAMLFYFNLAFYCNVSDAWTLPSRRHRLLVTFAGGWSDLVIAALCGLVWVSVEPGTAVANLAFLTMLLAGGMSLLFNLNPLIPLDGYYAVMDWLGISNLRPRAFGYLRARFERHVLKMDVRIPTVTPREHRAFLIYGGLALLYTTLILSLFGFLAGSFLVRHFGGWGWAISAVPVLLLVRGPWEEIRKLMRNHAALRSGRPSFGGRRLTGAAGATLATLVLLLLPWNARVPGVATVEPEERAWLRPPEEGWIQMVHVTEGALVRKGEPVATLTNPELEIDITRALAATSALQRERLAAQAAGRPDEARLSGIELSGVEAELRALLARRADLVLRAPFDGRFVAPRPDELVHARLTPADSVLELWRPGTARARVRLTERDAGQVRPGAEAAFRWRAAPAWTWRSEVQHVGPASHDGWVELLVPLGTLHPERAVRPGMTGRARIVVKRTNVAGALAWHGRRLLRTDWFL